VPLAGSAVNAPGHAVEVDRDRHAGPGRQLAPAYLRRSRHAAEFIAIAGVESGFSRPRRASILPTRGRCRSTASSSPRSSSTD